MNTHRPCRNQIHTLKQSHAPTHSDLHTRTHSHERARARAHTHTHTSARARTHTHPRTGYHTRTQVDTGLDMKLRTPTRLCVCARKHARAHTHTYADISPACGRERARRNRAISRTHTRAQNVTRARTNTLQNIRARAQPDVQAQPGTHGTAACTHMRVRTECARALTRY